MFKLKDRKKSVPIEDTEKESRGLASMEYQRYTCLTTTKKESPEALRVEVEKEEMPYLDLDFKEENILQAVVYSEIFGKPKSKRRKR
jgi:hypothetical protein